MKVTGKEVHEAYNKTQIDDVRKRGLMHTPTTVNEWRYLNKREKVLYDRLAENLNELIAAKEALS